MTTLTGDLEPLDTLLDGVLFKLVRGRLQGGDTVLLKNPSRSLSAWEAHEGVVRELDLLARYTVTSAIPPLNAIKVDGRSALMLQNADGTSLSCLLGQPLEAKRVLAMAIAITRALEAVHVAGILHLALTPESVFILPEAGGARLLHFALASEVGRETQVMVPATSLAGNLRYIAPEQTGRLGCGIDARCDLYSLGVIFYEMLSGAPPFPSEDPLELVHAHLARRPEPIQSPEVPPLGDVLARLLAKNPQERYQTARGLRLDLEALESLSDQPTALGFELGSEDIPPSLLVPDGLYGRRREVDTLLSAFRRSLAGLPTLVLVGGPGGFGKSALGLAVQPRVVQESGCFAQGKFEDGFQERPYSAWTDAFREIIRQLLTEPEDQLATYRSRLERSLGDNAAFIFGLVPELGTLLNQKLESLTAEGPTAEVRFRLAMQSFVDALTATEIPLVLFLDDLQWADRSSLALLTSVLGTRGGKLLIVATYRNDEISSGHPLLSAVADAESRSLAIERIDLEPLDRDAVNHWLADALYRPAADVKPLSDLLYDKSGGNPFFIRQLLKELSRAGHIYFAGGQWQWQPDPILDYRTSEGVVALLTSRMLELPEEVLGVLQVAALIGTQVEPALLAEVLVQPTSDVERSVVAAARLGLLDTLRSPTGLSFRFVHDRVRQAACLVADDEAPLWHLRIGQVLKQRHLQKDCLFELVDQLDQGRSAISEPKELQRLAKLNAEAGRRALDAASNSVAAGYFFIALELHGLTRDGDWNGRAWQDNYAEILALATDACRAIWASDEDEDFDTLAQSVIDHAENLLDAVPVYDLCIARASDRTHHRRALLIGREVMRGLGWLVPESPGKLAVIAGLLRVRMLLGNRSPEDFENLPRMTDPTGLAMMRVLHKMLAPAYFAGGNVLALIIFKMVSLSVRLGNAPQSPYSWNNYGFVLSNILGDYERGYAFSGSALAMHERTRTGPPSPGLLFAFAGFIRHWCEPMPDTLPMYREAHEAGKASGDLTYAGLSLQMPALVRLLDGERLDELERLTEEYSDWLTRVGQPQQRRMTALYRQVVLNLTGKGKAVVRLQGPAWDEAEMLPILEAAQDRTALGAKAIAELFLAVVVGDKDRALEVRSRAAEGAKHVPGTVWISLHTFLDALVATWPGENADLRAARKALKKLQRWAQFCPRNQAHRALLIEAEVLRALGKTARALSLYDRAARLARDTGARHHELGLIAERAVVAHEALHSVVAAEGWRREARRAFRTWGARVKEIDGPLQRADADIRLDFMGILRASQAVGREIRLDELLRRLTHLVCETLGAQRVCLMFEDGGQLRIQARGGVAEDVAVLEGTSIKEDLVPTSVINYVVRTHEPVILADAQASHRFPHQGYIADNEPRSLLCAPLLNQGRLAGVVYAENNLTVEAFRSERLEALALLSATAAGALDNARLVRDLQLLNRAYERFVPSAFLALLGKSAITEVDLGDHVEKEMTVLFSDIRSFTTMSEGMTPRETFNFINEYLSRMAPAVEKFGGVIDKYIGDAIMALFPGTPEMAFRAAAAMEQELARFNEERVGRGQTQVQIGTGIHYGQLMLGTIGMSGRMDGTVISDAVNLAARLEGLTRFYRVGVIASEEAVNQAGEAAPATRLLDRVRAKGFSRPVGIHQVLTKAEGPALSSKLDFESAVQAYFDGAFERAANGFDAVLKLDPDDAPALLMRERSRELAARGAPADWVGVHTMEQK